MTDDEYRKVFSGFTGNESDLIPLLQIIQEKEGFISEESAKRIASFLKISENRVYGVASFYTQFHFHEPGRNMVKVCLGTACHVRGAQVVSDAVERELNIHHGETTPDKRFSYERVACLGCCALGPVLQINNDIYGQVKVTQLAKIFDQYK